MISDRESFPELPDMSTCWWASGEQEEQWEAPDEVAEDAVKAQMQNRFA